MHIRQLSASRHLSTHICRFSARFFRVLAVVAGALVCFSPLAARAQVYFAGTAPVVLGSGFDRPEGVAVDAAGDVFVADNGNKAVKEIVAVNDSIPPSPTIRILEGVYLPEAVAVDAHGDVFFTIGSNVMEIVAVDGSIPVNPTIRILGSGWIGPEGVAVDAAGDVFVADTGNNAVKEIVAVDGSIPANPSIRILGSGFNEPAGAAVDAAGDVFVADLVNNAVKEILAVNGSIPDSPTILTLGSGLDFPYGVALDGAGDVFVADRSSEVKEILAVDGSIPNPPTIRILGSGFNDPLGVAVDAAGDVFVDDYGNNAVKEFQAQSVNFGSAALCETPTTAGCSQTLTLNYNVAAGTTITGVKILTQGEPGLDFQAEANDTSTTLCEAQTYTSATTCTVDVTFAPTAVGVRTGTVQLVDGSTVLATTGLSGTGIAAPAAQPSTSTLQFGTIAFGATETLPLTITNVGGGTLTVTPKITPGHSYTIASNTCSGVTAGNSCILQVEFSPLSVGSHDGDVLILQNNGPGTPTVALAGFASGIAVSPEPVLQFGTVTINTSEVLLLTLTNHRLPETVTFAPTLTGHSYTILNNAQNTCSQGIAAGNSCTLPIQFAPTAVGTHDHTLTLNPSTAVPIALTAVEVEGAGTALDLNPTSLDFYCYLYHLSEPEQCMPGGVIRGDVTVTNVGKTSLSITGIGTSGGAFSQANNCGSLAAGQSCTITVTFAYPRKAGTYTGELSISYDGVTSVVSLTGTVGEFG